uniref:Uncharacterized protein n=1 Tax=Globisporangium ultimum (strain ATCC 200006 / CBS 805.95 / DAOM BR144) TaxID=431595 RepID=K3WQ95_GLOUD
MKQIQILRSVSHAVLLLVHLRKLLRTKRLDQKEKAMQDFESMLNIYSSATRVWLGKIVRNPLMSILQEPSLNLDLSS